MKNKKSINIWLIYFTMRGNALIYILSKLPLIKDILPRNLLNFNKTKTLFSIVSVLFDVLTSIITVSVGTVLLIQIVPTKLFDFFGYGYQLSDGLILFIIVSCIAPAITQSDIFKLGKSDYMYLEYFQMDPSTYYKYKITRLLISKVIYVIPALVYVFKGEIFIVMSLIAIKFLIFVLGNLIYTSLYDKNSKLPKIAYRLSVAWFVRILTYGLLMVTSVNMKVISLVELGIILMVSLSISSYGVRKLFNYKSYLQVARNFVSSESLTLQVSVGPAGDGVVALNVTDLEENKSFLKENEHLSGVEYINKAYIERHKKYINRFYKHRSIFL